MSFLMRSAGLAACALASAAALPASAMPYTETYTGTVNAGSTDSAGLFGGGNIVGDVFTLSFTYSLTNGTNRYTSSDLDEVFGGDASSSPDPLLSVSASINGVAQSLLFSNYLGVTYICGAAQCGEDAAEAYVYDEAGEYAVDAYVFTNPLVADLAAVQSSVGSLGYATLSYDGDSINSDLTNVSFNTDVPEPASIAALGTGLLALGFIRHRRAQH